MAKVVGEAPDVLKRKACHGCGALVEYGTSDKVERSHRDYTGCLDTWSVVVCPRCQSDIRVD